MVARNYIADGFEVGADLRRDQLVFPVMLWCMSVQRGYKRHPDTARLQMQIQAGAQ